MSLSFDPEFNEQVAEFESVCDAYRDLLGSSECAADDGLIQSLTDSIISFKTKLYDWLNIKKKPNLYLQQIGLKLPYGLQACWRKTVNRVEETGGDVSFKDLVDFVDQQARIAKHLMFLAEALLEADGETSGRRQAYVVHGELRTLLATHISAPSEQSSTSESVDRDVGLSRCILCSSIHNLDECRSYIDLSIENRKQF